MHATLLRGAPADQLATQGRDAHCAEHDAPCSACEVQLAEVRAARRDALIHSFAAARTRRTAR